MSRSLVSRMLLFTGQAASRSAAHRPNAWQLASTTCLMRCPHLPLAATKCAAVCVRIILPSHIMWHVMRQCAARHGSSYSSSPLSSAHPRSGQLHRESCRAAGEAAATPGPTTPALQIRAGGMTGLVGEEKKTGAGSRPGAVVFLMAEKDNRGVPPHTHLWGWHARWPPSPPQTQSAHLSWCAWAARSACARTRARSAVAGKLGKA